MYGIPVSRLQREIDSAEFVELQALDVLEGLPGDGWRHAGTVAATIANVNRGKHSRPYHAADFMPRYHQPKSVEQQELMIRSIATVVNGKRVRNGYGRRAGS